MRLRKNQIGVIARRLAARLGEQQLVQWRISLPEAEAWIDRIIADELGLEDRLDAEVREIMRTHEAEIEKGQMDERRMFLMIKKQLAKDRGIIL